MRKMAWYWALALAAALVWPAMARGQSGDIGLAVDPNQFGLGGFVRPGAWTPLKVHVDNRSFQSRQVRVQWVLHDVDGDRVQAQRVVSLTPQRPTQVWLYAVPPASARRDTAYKINVIDDDTGRLLTSEPVIPVNFLEPTESAIGLTTSLPLGLQFFETRHTQQEDIRLIRGIKPEDLPDRWYGLSLIQTLVWTPDSGDPGSPAILPRTHEAIREWVRRGGHLVVVLPTVGELWTSSPLRDMLPPVRMQTLPDVMWPSALGAAKTTGASRSDLSVDLQALVPEPGADVSRLVFDSTGNFPIVVAHQYGLGRVTVMGVDLTDRRVLQLGLPASGASFWRTIMGWRSPALDPASIKKREEDRAIAPLQNRDATSLGRFMRGLIAMTGTYTGALMAAIVLFGIYWLAAGPVGFAMLKQRGHARHAWMFFAAAVLVFSALAWGGALLIRPTSSRIEHFSVVQAQADAPAVRTHSWLSLFVADHGLVNVALDPERQEGNVNTLAAPGLPQAGGGAEAEYAYSQSYTFDAVAPSHIAYPFRSTARQLELDYHGELGESQQALAGKWIMPQGVVRDVGGLPLGELAHDLPGTLQNVLFVYAPGDGKEPQVSFKETWAPRERVSLQPIEAQWVNLVDPRPADAQTPWKGFLPQRMEYNRTLFQPDDELVDTEVIQPPSDREIIVPVELLSFYSTLPTPEYWEVRTAFSTFNAPRHYLRPIGRELDLTHLLQLRRLIVIGVLRGAPLPAPLAVDGEAVPSSGWTVVQWSTPVQGE